MSAWETRLFFSYPISLWCRNLLLFFLGPAVEYDGQTCQGIPTPPPILGQHTNDVLTDILGYDRKEILKMEDEGVVKCY